MNHRNETKLNGNWRFRVDPDKLGEHFKEQLDACFRFDARWMDGVYDDSEWVEMKVPANWQTENLNYNGVAWYRRRFPMQKGENSRIFLRFDGVDYFSDVWLNDHYLGSHEGYFSAFQYEVTPYLRQGENLLAVRVDAPNDLCSKERQTWQFKNQVKGALQRWDMNDPDVNPGGIWNDVKFIETGPGAISRIKIHGKILSMLDQYTLDQPVQAHASIEVIVAGFSPTTLDSQAQLRVRITPVNLEGDVSEASLPIDALEDEANWIVTLEIDEAHLWNTWDLGSPCLYDVSVALEVNGSISDEVHQNYGFRRIRRGEGWETILNGVRIFQRGANYLSDQLLSRMTPERYVKDIELLKEANLNTVHPFALVERQEFYDQCDLHGIMAYQDFPIWLEASNSGDLVRRSLSQLRELVEQYGHHPSICIWNFGSQPSVANFTKLCSALTKAARELDPTRISNQANALIDPTGNRYDPVGDFYWKKETIEDFQKRFDWRVDTHQYFGWYYSKRIEDLDTVPQERLQLVTEFGAQALPSRNMLEKMIPKDKLFPPSWPYYSRRCFQPEQQFNYIGQPSTLDEFIEESQDYQASFIKYHTEYYRLHKFNLCNGAHLFCFNDCWPAITWSVVDYDRQPKKGYYALKRAMSPLQVFLVFKGRSRPTIYVVNDYVKSYPGIEVKWVVKNPLEEVVARGTLHCNVHENSIQPVGELEWCPEDSQRYYVQLSLSKIGKEIACNSYEWLI